MATPADTARATPEAIAQMRALLVRADDDALDKFLSGHAIATIADHLISLLNADARLAFFAAMREKYPAEAGRGGNG